MTLAHNPGELNTIDEESSPRHKFASRNTHKQAPIVHWRIPEASANEDATPRTRPKLTVHFEEPTKAKEDVLIAVVGPAGSGKSTFIKLATGLDIAVGHDLEPCTRDFGITRIPGPHYDVVLIDTPGFDALDLSEAKVLESLSDWLQTSFNTSTPTTLSGLLYFHRITDNRKVGSPLRNLGIFKELCGKDSLNNIVLTTTLWNDIDEEAGSLRETQLKEGYWQPMIARGSRMRRFSGTRQSALQLLRPFIDQANAIRGVRLRVILPTEFPREEAIPMFRTKIALLQVAHKQQQEILRKIEEEVNTPDNSAKLHMLRKEYEDLKSTSSSLLEQMCTSDVWDRGTLF